MIDINFISPTGGIVKSVNGKTGRVELTAKDVGAATPEDVANAVGAIEIPEVDFTGYATEEYVAKKIAEAELAESDVDLSAYYTKSETDKAIKTAVDAIEIPETDLSNYATKSYVNTQIAANEPDLTNYATKDYVAAEIAEAQLAEGEVDLSGFYTKSETDEAIEEAIGAIEIPSTAGLASEKYVDDKIAAIPKTDLSSYATQTYVQEQIEAIPETDLSNYYTKQQTNDAIAANVPDMSLYATKTYVGNQIAAIDIPSTDGLATETFVTEKIAEAQLAEGEVDLTGYATEKYVDDAIAGIEHPTTDLSNYYNKQEVDAKIPDTSGFLTEVPAEYITETELEEALANIPTGGGSGSVAIDGVTIVENEDGTISTSIGVMKGWGAIYEWGSSDLATDSWGYYSASLPGAPTSYVYGETYKVRFTLVYFDDSTYEYVSNATRSAPQPAQAGDISCSKNVPGYGGSGSYMVSISGETLSIAKCPAARIENFAIEQDGAGVDNTKIPTEAVPIDGTSIVVNSDGVLSAVTASTADSLINYTYAVGEKHVIELAPANTSGSSAPHDVALNIGKNTASGFSNSYGRYYLFGANNVASIATSGDGGQSPIAIGTDNSVGTTGIAYGYKNTCKSTNAMSFGYWNTVGVSNANAFGRYLKAVNAGQTVVGSCNIEDTEKAYRFIVGIGTSASDSDRTNGLTIDASGNVVAGGTISNGGADYAEYFEWADGNPEAEDRVGLLVALEGDKIRLAQADDDILGVISGTATVLGDDAEWAWQGKYLRDEYGRLVLEDVEMTHEEEVVNEDGEVSIITVSDGFYKSPKINPEYNEAQPYVSRAKRSEWDAVGMMGKLFVRDNGTCAVNGYAAPAANGLVTAATGKTNMRVMERISDNIIRICLK